MILGVIPARGGSKGVPGKHLKPLCGKPLIEWTIYAARASRRLDRYVVSTEDREIAAVARASGAEVLDRPAELATDEASTLSVLQHVVRQLDADVIVLLQATSPVRDAGLIDRCIERFLETGADSLATGFVCKATAYGQQSLRRQDVPGFFCDDGNVYVIKADLLKRGDRYGTRLEQMVVDRECNVDIDDEFDFWMAERILEQRRLIQHASNA